MNATSPDTHLYWATGCTSCLRAKEFLERNSVPYVSHNVIEEEDAFDEMADQGLPRRVPIIKRGDEWKDAHELKNVAEIAGIEHKADPLPVEELRERLDTFLDAAQRFLDKLPESELETDIPNRPRSYADLVFHIFSIAEAFLQHEAGITYNAPREQPAWNHHSKPALTTYGQDVQERLNEWFDGPGQTRDWSTQADVFYGSPTLHEYFERTTWHAGQHTRQLEWILQEEVGIEVENPISPEVWEGLPVPEKVWDTV